jgi:hypothetical protein
MVTRTNVATGEAFLVPDRNRWRKVHFITRDTRKEMEDKKVAEGCVVATKQGNSCGAKAPY